MESDTRVFMAALFKPGMLTYEKVKLAAIPTDGHASALVDDLHRYLDGPLGFIGSTGNRWTAYANEDQDRQDLRANPFGTDVLRHLGHRVDGDGGLYVGNLILYDAAEKGLTDAQFVEIGEACASVRQCLEHIEKHSCTHCGKRYEHVLRMCSRCYRVYYCDDTCQRANWMRWHKPCCTPVRHPLPMAGPPGSTLEEVLHGEDFTAYVYEPDATEKGSKRRSKHKK
jgi:hypothetical protein